MRFNSRIHTRCDFAVTMKLLRKRSFQFTHQSNVRHPSAVCLRVSSSFQFTHPCRVRPDHFQPLVYGSSESVYGGVEPMEIENSLPSGIFVFLQESLCLWLNLDGDLRFVGSPGSGFSPLVGKPPSLAVGASV